MTLVVGGRGDDAALPRDVLFSAWQVISFASFPSSGGYDFATAGTGPSDSPSIEVGSVWMLLAICLFVCCLFVQGGKATAAQAQGGTCLLLFPNIYVNQVNQARNSASLESPHSWQRKSDSLGHGNEPGEVVP